ncbi:endolytic transglycosylase MltG [Sulfurimonas sp.]|uniref:endolytic transglycosylase MltG n=1 Tax=Sulfurimonas sp. TaxID=2022749 RepID=UPI00391E0371
MYTPFFKNINIVNSIKNMNDRTLMVIKWIFEIVLIIILSFMYYLNQPVNSPKVIYIPEGSISKIITQLHNKNYNVSKLDTFLLRIIGSPQSGWINIGTTLNSRGDFLYKLTTAKAALQSITLIPGETTYIFFDQLAQQLKLDRDVLQKEYELQSSWPEGAFVPNTYMLPIGITEKMVIKILLKESLSQMMNVSQKIFGTYNEKRWFHFVTVASIIQKESASIKEMPLVSSVIQNRIKKGMKLQMDGTLNYGKYSHVKVTSSMIKEDKSTYNTYLYGGIPPAPVCNVSFDAIRAAIFPAESNHLYFMKSKNGSHDFACNYSTHLTNIKRATK